MFELPEVVTLAGQVRERLTGRIVVRGSLGARPHKFVSYNRTPDEFGSLVAGLTVAGAPDDTAGGWTGARSDRSSARRSASRVSVAVVSVVRGRRGGIPFALDRPWPVARREGRGREAVGSRDDGSGAGG